MYLVSESLFFMSFSYHVVFYLDTLSVGLSSILYFEQLIMQCILLLLFIIVYLYVNWDSESLGPYCLLSTLVWSSRHGYNFELGIFTTIIPMVNIILEL